MMTHDAIIIGASFAGLATATYAGRARLETRVIDAGQPRNRFAPHSHGFLTHDGSVPGDILATARGQAQAYPTVRFVEGSAASAAATEDGFAVGLASGETLTARRLVLAYGLHDELPEIPGLAERWGRSVSHCPYCHGYEFSDRRLGVLATSPMSVHQAQLIPAWGPTTFFLNGYPMPEPELLADLERRGVTVETRQVAALMGDGPALSAIRLADGSSIPIEALYVGPRSYANSDIARQLGCIHEEIFWGSMIQTDAMQQTSVPGVFAAGDIARGGHSVTFAAADGVMAATALHRSLVFA
jgi:thioredoxin reductase